MIRTARNSGTFYFSGAESIEKDWTLPNNDALWRDGVKTLFDPCPMGWRVPKSGNETSGHNPWSSFTADNGTGYKEGWQWHIYGGTVWYPLSPRRYYTSGKLQSGAGFIITTARDPTSNSSARHFVCNESRVLIYDVHSRAHCHSVRCLRE